MLQQDKLHPVRSATTSQVGSVSPSALPSSHQKGQAQQGRPSGEMVLVEESLNVNNIGQQKDLEQVNVGEVTSKKNDI